MFKQLIINETPFNHTLSDSRTSHRQLKKKSNSTHFIDNRPQKNILPQFNIPTPSYNSIIQCKLNITLRKGWAQNKYQSQIGNLIFAYNARYDRKTLNTRINELHELQTKVIKLLDEAHSPDQYLDNDLIWLRDAMNEIQKEHIFLIENYLSNVSTNPVESIDPPIANYDQLPVAVQNKVKALWVSLVKGTGNIKITETETQSPVTAGKPLISIQHHGFRKEALAMFARLLETRTGLNLIGELNEDTKGQKVITIQPGYAYKDAFDENSKTSDFAAGAESNDNSDKLTLVEIDKLYKGRPNATKMREDYSKKFIELKPSLTTNPRDLTRAIYAARQDKSCPFGVKINNQYYRFGKGSAVHVTLLRDIRDADDHPAARFINEQQLEIPVPNFITLAHELGHALHIQRGMSLDDDLVDKIFFREVLHSTTLDWTNMEEFGNINNVENILRKELGLTDRYGHINQPYLQYKIFESLYVAIHKLYELHEADGIQLPTDQVTNGYYLIGDMKTKEGRIILNESIRNFTQNISFIFPHFTPTEKSSVQTSLEMIPNINYVADKTEINLASKKIEDAISLVQNIMNRH